MTKQSDDALQHPQPGEPSPEDEPTLSRAEAEVAGMITPVYGEVGQADEQRDVHDAEPDDQSR